MKTVSFEILDMGLQEIFFVDNFPDIRCYTIYHGSQTRFHISSFKHSIWLPISFLIKTQMFYIEFLSGEFPGHFRTGIPLHCRNVLVFLELWHGAKSSIRYIPSVETQPVHASLYFTVIAIVWSKQNEKYHAKCIQPVSVQV